METYTNEEIDNRLHIDIGLAEREILALNYKLQELSKTAKRIRKEKKEIQDSIVRKKALLEGSYKSI